jgi:hypothetical protein
MKSPTALAVGLIVFGVGLKFPLNGHPDLVDDTNRTIAVNFATTAIFRVR